MDGKSTPRGERNFDAMRDKAFEIIGYNYDNMTYNSTCDLFPQKESANMSPLQSYLINACTSRLEELQLLQM